MRRRLVLTLRVFFGFFRAGFVACPLSSPLITSPSMDHLLFSRRPVPVWQLFDDHKLPLYNLAYVINKQPVFDTFL